MAVLSTKAATDLKSILGEDEVLTLIEDEVLTLTLTLILIEDEILTLTLTLIEDLDPNPNPD